MGVSTDGMLFYGVLLPDGYEAPWLPDDRREVDWEEWWAKKQGLGDIGFDAEKREWSPEEEALYRKWADQKRELVKTMPIEIHTHCSDGYPMYLIAAKGTYRWNSRGYGTHIPNLTVPPDGVRSVAEFCRDHLGVEIEVYDPDKHKGDHDFKLGWWLVSYWG